MISHSNSLLLSKSHQSSPKTTLPILNLKRPNLLNILPSALTDRKTTKPTTNEQLSPKLTSLPASPLMALTTRNNGPVDEQTAGNIKKIIDDRQREIIRETQKKLQAGKKGEPLSRIEKDLETITKIKKFMQNKGLSGKRKKKLQFDKKFNVFDSVKTFVDARRLFQNAVDSRTSPIAQERSSPPIENKSVVPELNLLMTNKNLEATFDTVMTEYKDSDGISSKPVLDDEPDELKKVLHSPSPQIEILNYADDIYPPETEKELPSPILKQQKSRKSPRHERTLSVEEMKVLKIRRLYQDLRSRTIEKLGPKIFENIQHKLSDPDVIKQVEQKRLKQLAVNRVAQRELNDFELGHGIVHHLKNKKQGLQINLQAENYSVSNQFEKFLDKELLTAHEKSSGEQLIPEDSPENIEDLVLPFLATREETEEFRKILDEERNQTLEQRLEKDEDPQIRMLLKARQFKEKTTTLVHALKNKIVEAYAEEGEESPGGSPGGRYKERSPSIARYSRVLPRMPSLHLLSGNNSPVAGDKTTRAKKLSLMPISPLKEAKDGSKRLSMPPIETSRRKKGLSLEPIANSYSSVFATSLPYADEFPAPTRGASPRHLSNLSSSRNFDNESRRVSKKKVDDFYHQLDDLSSFTKDINNNMKSRLRQMEDPLGHHVKALRRLEIPECLQVVPNIGYIRSTAKLATNLARQTLKMSKENED